MRRRGTTPGFAPARASARWRPSSRRRSFVSSSAADLEPSVLASRCSSWIRKSSRLPSSPPAFSTAGSNSSRWANAVARVPRPRRCGWRRSRPRSCARSCSACAWARCRRPAPAGGECLLPALQKALPAGAATTGGQQRLAPRWPAHPCRLMRSFQQHGHQASRLRARATSAQALDAAP